MEITDIQKDILSCLIENAIAHLNGYVIILEKEKQIPALGVKETITGLKKFIKELQS